jgi:hypothetical protein
MRKLILFGAATTMLLAGAVAWTTSTHSAIEPSIDTAQIDPLLSMMANVAVTDFVSGTVGVKRTLI